MRAVPQPYVPRACADRLRPGILAWYDGHARDLPWRVGPAARASGRRPDPYRVWLSEIMLQQTTVPHATPYFLEFTRRWPTVTDLAAAEDGEVMAAWAGLGYYARARNLIACARHVARTLEGVFPDTEAGLRALPGVGPYTAAAIAAIAFDRPANVVDGNVERVVARLFAVERPLPAAKPELRALAGDLIADDRPGDWAQALMDLGAMVCTPTSPDCPRCPATSLCAAEAGGHPARYPLKSAKPERPRRFGAAYLLTRGNLVALVRRPAKGLLGGMLALPTSEWRSAPWSEADAVAAAPASVTWREAGEIEHGFTHFTLTLSLFRAEGEWPDGLWRPRSELASMPSVFLKAARAALVSPTHPSKPAHPGERRDPGRKLS
ncbi:MAG TPA: A/G-specific adenine glycosylase [Caulobacteraceae bacterium]|nr:A/G-specific adenine glycosylase [Caulobacteraceae bacterium]